MEKLHAFLRKAAAWITAVTLVTAVVVPEVGGYLAYADTQSGFFEQTISNVSENAAEVSAQDPTAGEGSDVDLADNLPAESESEAGSGNVSDPEEAAKAQSADGQKVGSSSATISGEDGSAAGNSAPISSGVTGSQGEGADGSDPSAAKDGENLFSGAGAEGSDPDAAETGVNVSPGEGVDSSGRENGGSGSTAEGVEGSDPSGTETGENGSTGEGIEGSGSSGTETGENGSPGEGIEGSGSSGTEAGENISPGEGIEGTDPSGTENGENGPSNEGSDLSGTDTDGADPSSGSSGGAGTDSQDKSSKESDESSSTDENADGETVDKSGKNSKKASSGDKEEVLEEAEEDGDKGSEDIAGEETPAPSLPAKGGICQIRLLALANNVITELSSEAVKGTKVSSKYKQKFFAEKSGKYWKFINTVTGKVLGVSEADKNGSRTVRFAESSGTGLELWEIVPSKNGYMLKSVADGRVLTIGLYKNGRSCILTKPVDNPRQIWGFESCTETLKKATIEMGKTVSSSAERTLPLTEVRIGSYKLVENVDYTLTGGTEPGTAKAKLKGIGRFTGTYSQDYTIFDSVGSIEDGGWYQLVPKTDLSLVAGAKNDGMVNGTGITSGANAHAESQIFQLQAAEDGKYTLTNARSEKVIALNGSGHGSAAALRAKGYARSEFKVSVLGDGSFVFRSANNRYLKILQGKMVGANKKITDSACFYLVRANAPSHTFSNSYTIRTLTRIRLVLGISGSSTADGAQTILTNYSDITSQRFSFLYSGDGYYRIVSEKSRKVLTANAEGSIVQTSWTGASAQRWKPRTLSNGYSLVNGDGKVLTINAELPKNGKTLCAADENGSSLQTFLLLVRGSGEAKRNLVKKPITIYNSVNFSPVYNYDDYMDRYNDLAEIYGTDCAGALKHFVEEGMPAGKHGSNEFDVWCYRRSNPEVRKQLLADITAYYIHYLNEGRALGLKASGSYQTTQAPALHDLAWKAYNEWGDFSNRPYGQQICEILSQSAEVQYQAYGFPKSVIIAMSIKECGFLTFNGGLPPASNNVLTMNVSMWNALWKSGWLGGYVTVSVPQYDSATQQIVYGYEDLRSYEDIEACMEDFANYKVSRLGPVPEGMSIDDVITIYLQGYATSPGYQDSIRALIKLHQLTRFDH